MAARHPPIDRSGRPLPRLWLMTDERLGERLVATVKRLPRGAGIVFRHHATEPVARAMLFARLGGIARSRGLVLLNDDDPRIARVHDGREARRARHGRAALAFVSPVFATRTHPGAKPLGPVRAALLLRASRLPGIALGGMDARRFGLLRRAGFEGWAAIDSLGRGRQKRKAVPI